MTTMATTVSTIVKPRSPWSRERVRRANVVALIPAFLIGADCLLGVGSSADGLEEPEDSEEAARRPPLRSCPWFCLPLSGRGPSGSVRTSAGGRGTLAIASARPGRRVLDVVTRT